MKSVVSNLLSKDTPIQLMIDHVKILVEVSDILEELVTLYLDQKDVSELVQFISDKENEADEIKFKLRNLLDKKIKVPFSKMELIYSMHLQDDLIDLMKDVAKRMSMNGLEFELPKKARQDFIQLVREVKEMISYLDNEINELKVVLTSAFAKQERKKEEEDIVKIEELESQVDKLTLKLGKWVYSKKNKLNPMDLLFFNQMVIIFSEISDKAENLAEMLRSFTR